MFLTNLGLQLALFTRHPAGRLGTEGRQMTPSHLENHATTPVGYTHYGTQAIYGHWDTTLFTNTHCFVCHGLPLTSLS